ncbi:MAG: 4Fe-4S dicluster domain-containing protein [Rhodobacterales bacterium]|nr:4Fe-4S dicluster domain-containing protein [Rhodobacterales bacterium]
MRYTGPMDLADLHAAARAAGLDPRGAFHPDDSDALPGAPGTVLLLGFAGGNSKAWAAFAAAPERADGADHALDRWTRRVGDALAAALGVGIVYPFDGPPWWPFQRWAIRAGGAHPSPMGPLIHPDLGLWHAYRAALLVPARLALPPRDDRPSPCATCADTPCLTTCPVGALSGDGYDVPACAAHLRGPDGPACLEAGCLARAACPVAAAHRYGADQRRFHMEAFLRSHGG